MFTAKRTYNLNRPETFQNLNNGTWYYNYDIHESTIQEEDLLQNKIVEQHIYDYVSVRVSEPVTVDKCIEALLNTFKDENNTTLYNYNIISRDSQSEYFTNKLCRDVKVDFRLEQSLTVLEKIKQDKIKQIEQYDYSDNVNSFTLNGVKVWLDKSTRVGLMNSLNIEKTAGKETSTLWFGNIKIDINTEAAIQMLSSLELYALECYNKTAEHKVNVGKLTSVEDVKNYDFTKGYPDKLNFNV